MAEVFSNDATRSEGNGKPFARAGSQQSVFDGSRWRIAGVLRDEERAGLKLPKDRDR
jgi:hypothetical protein